MTVPGAWYLGLSALLFGIGATGLLVRRNVLVMFMCVELMLNAVNLTFITFSRMLDDIGGQSLVFFVMVVAAWLATLMAGGSFVFSVIVFAGLLSRSADHRLFVQSLWDWVPVGGFRIG